ncbi:DUF3883 domain-containing protein [Bacillus sp. FJAT-29790]|uniref:protein NO VEIN domain-containing protein n=1 Tax=Bacillus sp. FJAT-29790 TaxID=1895002 RepID=UPI001C248033|nr:DUF3883 domain-containing protein [Bacillus sp. FJAT-29790]MBU8877958.1 DUF3883 domain-containing protein [Bacillus sp. FJAT-29790]
MNYSIIAENDESQWEDQTGILYHFPARYKNILTPGTKVIYYKSRMKNREFASMRLSKEPHYFGLATIGEVYPYTNTAKNQYFAKIEEYIPFGEAIDFKDSKNNYLENVSKSNYWRDGVRKITKEIYIKIVSLSNLDIQSSKSDEIEVEIIEDTLPSIHEVTPKVVDNLFIKKIITNDNNSKTKQNARGNGYSRNAKKIGDRAEQVVLKYLADEKMNSIRWLANEGEKPGYDISCKNNDGNEIYIEVKGTTTSKFDGFIITDNELKTSEKLGDKFYIYFVTNCLSKNPRIQPIQNPYKKVNLNEWELTPLSYRVSFS